MKDVAVQGRVVGHLGSGLIAGIGLALVIIAASMLLGDDAPSALAFPGLERASGWIHANLRGSLYPFVGILVLFVVAVERLRHALQAGQPLDAVAQAEYWAELWTSLFFGVGVIWTAIGMRSALLAGLGNLDSSVAAEVGAFAILRRLVDGGILLALSTTIVGGIGGYLMRVHKGLRTGGLLRARYAREAQASEHAVLSRLDALESHLGALVAHADRGDPVLSAPR